MTKADLSPVYQSLKRNAVKEALQKPQISAHFLAREYTRLIENVIRYSDVNPSVKEEMLIELELMEFGIENSIEFARSRKCFT